MRPCSRRCSSRKRAVLLTVSRRIAPPSSLMKRKPRLPLIFATTVSSNTGQKDAGFTDLSFHTAHQQWTVEGIEPSFVGGKPTVLPLEHRQAHSPTIST